MGLKILFVAGIVTLGLTAQQAGAGWSANTTCMRAALQDTFNGCVAAISVGWQGDSDYIPVHQSAYCTLDGVKIYDFRTDKSYPEPSGSHYAGAAASCGKSHQLRCFIINGTTKTQIGNPSPTACPPM